MDKRKGFLNVCASLLSKIVLLFVALFVRRLLILKVGNDVNGLNSLYSSIIGMLAVAELGIGRAIVYSMYGPIVEGNQQKIAALYQLYRKLYGIIGGIIFFGGLAIMPFLQLFINDYESINENIYLTFLLTLISVVLSYLYSAKTALIEAHKNNYITTGIATISSLARHGFQIIVLLLWKSFPAFLICDIVGTLIIWLLTELVVRKSYQSIICMHESLDESAKKDIIRNIKAMFMHKIGIKLVNSVDGLIISGFIGVMILGKYSNYTFIASTMVAFISLFFTSLTSVVGHLCAEGNKDKSRDYFEYFYFLNFILGVVFFLGYYAVINSVITLFFGSGLELSQSMVFIITLNQFIQYMRTATLLFRNASGNYYYDRWKPIAEGIVNLVLSLLFVWIFPNDLKVVGVIVATIITNLLICDTVEPYVVFRYVFEKSPKAFYGRNFAYIGLFIIALIAMYFVPWYHSNAFFEILVNGLISVGVSFAVFVVVAIVDREFRKTALVMMRKAVGPLSKKFEE